MKTYCNFLHVGKREFTEISLIKRLIMNFRNSLISNTWIYLTTPTMPAHIYCTHHQNSFCLHSHSEAIARGRRDTIITKPEQEIKAEVKHLKFIFNNFHNHFILIEPWRECGNGKYIRDGRINISPLFHSLAKCLRSPINVAFWHKMLCYLCTFWETLHSVTKLLRFLTKLLRSPEKHSVLMRSYCISPR